jgi:hypothetical protein
MLLFQVAAGLYALLMLVRHARPALRGQVASVLICLASLAVLATAAWWLLAARPG